MICYKQIFSTLFSLKYRVFFCPKSLFRHSNSQNRINAVNVTVDHQRKSCVRKEMATEKTNPNFSKVDTSPDLDCYNIDIKSNILTKGRISVKETCLQNPRIIIPIHSLLHNFLVRLVCFPKIVRRKKSIASLHVGVPDEGCTESPDRLCVP